MIKNYFMLSLIASAITLFSLDSVHAQNGPIYPTVIKTPVAFEITKPLRDNPVVTPKWFDVNEFYMNQHRDREINPNIFPPDFNNMPADPGEQTKPGWIQAGKTTLQNFAGQTSGSYPPDANGTVGSNYYFQVVNVTYAIYNKTTGAVVAGPSNLNSIFNSTLPGANCNNGDPIVLWDQQANRWFYAEFSLCGSTDYMLIAVSQTNDPTGSWYSWSFDVDDMPDYMKFGIWQDGYYMATNTNPGNDVYVFDRATMLAGGSNPTMIGFDNAWRPNTFDGFHCILPVDNDGPWAPSGTPGQFITIVDDGQGNSADQLWIYQLNANWSSPSSSTFSRTQMLNVNAFSGNFNNSWNNIPQPVTNQKLDGLSTILMFRAQYRNFSGTQRLVCAHAIAESSSEAAMRWYELENTGTTWSIRQQGTYNPDNVSRWNMSIAMNGQKEIGIGYSVSNSSIYPGIRYIGQSTASNTAANSTLDMAETVIWNGTNYQTTYNRWGDYANISVDPSDDHTFWFTSEYVSGSTHGTRIASFEFSTLAAPPVADFTASNTMPLNSFTTVNFTDISTGSPSAYLWTFSPSSVTYVSGSSTSQNISVRFDNPGAYTVTLQATNGYGSDSETKTAYIHMGQPGKWTGTNSTAWSTNTNWENHMVPDATIDVSILPTATNWPLISGNLTIGTDCNSISFASGYTKLSVSGDLTVSAGKLLYVDPSGTATIEIGGDFNAMGNFVPGNGTVEFFGSTASTINTPLSTPVNLVNDDFSTWPANWNGNIGSGNGYFSSVTSSNAGGTSPEVRFYWINSNTTRRIYSNALNTAGMMSLSLDFKYAVNNYAGTAYTLKVQYSTDGINWYDSDWSVSPSGNIGATNVSTTLTSASHAVGSAVYYIAFTITGNLFNINYWYIDDVLLSYSPPGVTTFNNIIDNKNAATLTINGDVNISSDLIIRPGAYLTNGVGKTLTVANAMVLESDAGGMASFIDNGTTLVAGNTYSQLYLTPQSWHYVSSPVSGALSGIFNGIFLKSFVESTDSWSPNITSLTDPLNTMQGYAAWVPGTLPATVTFDGMLNDGPYAMPVTNNGTLTDQGWNFAGNPYPSSLDWDAAGWTKTNVNNTVYYYSGNGGLSNYKYYIGSGGETPGVGVNSGTNEIPPMQGFFVHASATGTLGVSNNARIHSGQSYYKMDKEVPLIRLLAEGNGMSDETVIRFVSDATSGFDDAYDAFKLFAGDHPQVYTLENDGVELAVNSLPEIQDDLVIPVSFVGIPQNNYVLKLKEITDFPVNQQIYLEDLLLSEIRNITTQPAYNFTYNEEMPDRFLLHFSNPLGINDLNENRINVYAYNQSIYVMLPDYVTAKVGIFDMTGRKVLEQDHFRGGLNCIHLDSAPGFYLVKVESGKNVVSAKVILR